MSQLFLDKRGKIPLELMLMIEQAAPVSLADLNPTLPDAFWITKAGKNRGIEIKQVGEVLGSIGDVEEQLAREYNQVDDLSLCIAGVVLPNPDGKGCYALRMSEDGLHGFRQGLRHNEPYHQDYAGYRSWLEGLRHWGIDVIEMPTILSLAKHLVAMYNYDQKAEEEHGTFKRPLRTKRVMGSWSPYVLSVMGLVDPANGRTFIGPEIAEGLVDALGSPSAVLNAEEAVLARVPLRSGKRTVGPAAAAKIKRAAG